MRADAQVPAWQFYESRFDLMELTIFEEYSKDDHYMIICLVCGYDEFEDIVVRAKQRIRWSKKFIWEIGIFPRYIHSIRCLTCDYILNFARE